jgi:hypothetical protein
VIPSLDPEDKIAEHRDDDHALAPIARAGGGVLIQLAGAVGRPAEALAASVLGLVRPIRIDHFAIQGLPAGAKVDQPNDDTDDALAEGSGRRFFVSLDKKGEQVNQVVLSGEIWAQPFAAWSR